MRDRLASMFEAAGLPHSRDIEHVPNSRKALLVAEVAREQGLYEPVHERLFRAYWVDGRDLGDEDVLVDEAGAAGLDEDAVREELASEAHLPLVEAETRRLLEIGGGGVPAWAVDGRVLIPGAQPHDVFERVLERLGHAPLDGPDGASGAPADRPRLG